MASLAARCRTKCSTPVYEGPFELLLHLILKEEVDIWDVSIAQVIDRFMIEIEKLDRVDLDVATEFLLIASTLVELKVRRLLPGAEMTELDEELMRFEERDLLLARLLECKTFKDAARVLESHAAPRRQGRLAQRRSRGAVPFALARSARAGHAGPAAGRRGSRTHTTASAARDRSLPRRADSDQRARSRAKRSSSRSTTPDR